MPKRILPETALSETRDEIVFTRGALKAHPIARVLLPETEGWLAPITALRDQMETNEVERIELDAEYKILNAAFDADCIEFSPVALKAAGGDREDTRYTRYFAVAPSVFVKQDIDEQVKAVEGWLTVQDPTLDPWRERFAAHLAALKDHRARRRASQQKTRSFEIAREAAATTLTDQRDALHRRLGEQGQQSSQPRGYADLFFRIG